MPVAFFAAPLIDLSSALESPVFERAFLGNIYDIYAAGEGGIRTREEAKPESHNDENPAASSIG